jgi:amidohydrolase
MILNEFKDEFKGGIKFMFEPNEENEGGAEIMIKNGALYNPKVDAAISIHCGDGNSLYEEGKVLIKKDKAFASLTEFTLTFYGKSGHVANQKTLVNPIFAASSFIAKINDVVNKLVPQSDPSVLAFGTIKSSSMQANIVPESVGIKGSIRTIDDDVKKSILDSINELLIHTSNIYGNQYKFEITLD